MLKHCGWERWLALSKKHGGAGPGRRMGAIVDSVFDGQFLWALSRDTLWRVDLVHRLIRQVQMPEHGLKPPFKDLFEMDDYSG